MTARTLATLALALGLTPFAGCSGAATATKDTTAGDDDDTVGDDDDAVDLTADTSTDGDDGFVPALAFYSAAFGFDADAGTMIEVNSTYGPLVPTYRIEIGNAAWEASGFDPYAIDDYCIVDLPLTSSDFAPWAQVVPTLWYGVDYAGDPPLTDCLPEYGFDVDPAVLYGYPDLATLIAAFPWGIAVGEIADHGGDGSYEQDALDFVAGYSYGYLPPGSFVGGSRLDGLLGGTQYDDVLVWAEEIDANAELTGVFLPATSIHPGAGIATGYYNFFILYGVRFY